MATELNPGTLRAVFARVEGELIARGRMALEPLALVIERQAKINAANGSHRYGTPSPASPGLGPAIISGTLRRSITHSPITMVGAGWETKVGMGTGFFPPYGSRRTPSSKYAMYLETGLRNGARYPFLEPAFRFAIRTAAPIIFSRAYGEGWTQLA